QLSEGTSLRGGAYTVTGLMGHGGFSVVYEARKENCLNEQNKVAIKEIVCNFGGTSRSLERNLRQMLQEASVLSRLDHPNIVKFEHCFAEGNRLYIVMEALDGVNLRRYGLSEQRPSEGQLLDMAAQCCAILSYLHSQPDPIIHRDFTPDNLMFCDGVVKLLDFNIAQSAITSSSGTIVGKHCYMSPEQFCGEYTVSGDLYQLGATMYFMATGEDPEPLGPCDLRSARTDLSDEFQYFISVLTDRISTNRPASATAALQILRPSTACR
ncbi:MAG: serine/threonine protein kinase, partial [Candidatus Obscuribacterales bacterium]|nr:serine/threonine protein kinase [Candidatus Obscuribacterales bacterium]